MELQRVTVNYILEQYEPTRLIEVIDDASIYLTLEDGSEDAVPAPCFMAKSGELFVQQRDVEWDGDSPAVDGNLVVSLIPGDFVVPPLYAMPKN